MLRLAHRMISMETAAPEWLTKAENVEWVPILMHQMERTIAAMQTATVVVADNVMETYAAGSKIDWDFNEDFPNILPPCPVMFMEMARPSYWRCDGGDVQSDGFPKQSGWFLLTRDIQNHGPGNLPPWVSEYMHENEKIRFVTNGQFWCTQNAGQPLLTGADVWLFIGHNGEPIDYAFTQTPMPINLDQFAMAFVWPMLLAISLMHCKNVVRIDATETEGPPKKWLRRMKQPEIRYHVLNIDPMKEVLRCEGGIETNGLKKALHICRGHFRTYSEESKGMFGRLHGTFWVPQHARGDKALGEVKKDYNVKAPR